MPWREGIERGIGRRGEPHVRGGLALEDAELGVQVGFHGAVPGEMVGREVQDRGPFRMEITDGFQLIAGALEGVAGLRPPSLHGRHERCPEIPAGHGRNARRLEEMGQEIGGRALAVGPRDRQDPRTVRAPAQDPMSQFQFADDGDAPMQGFLDEGDAGRNARAEHDLATAVQERQRMIAPYPGNVHLGQLGEGRGVRFRSPVGHEDFGPGP